MRRNVVACTLLALGLAGTAATQEIPTADAPGWTGATNPGDVIAARRALMNETARLMIPIDTATTGTPVDVDEVETAAATIAVMLLATPHLFPPTTNLYDPADEQPATLALPAIWQDFPSFQQLSITASEAATRIAEGKAAADLPAAATGLRASCDSCHAVYMRAYVPAEAGSEDTDFDFDSIFQ